MGIQSLLLLPWHLSTMELLLLLSQTVMVLLIPDLQLVFSPETSESVLQQMQTAGAVEFLFMDIMKYPRIYLSHLFGETAMLSLKVCNWTDVANMIAHMQVLGSRT